MAIYDYGNRRFDDAGNCFLTVDGVIELMYQGKDIDTHHIIIDPNDKDVEQYNHYSYAKKLYNDKYFPVNITERKNVWFYPPEYDTIDVLEFFAQMCKTPEEWERAENEVKMFFSKGFEKFLRFCIYLAVVLKQNDDIVHGVGRGSSCACFLLYLLGINKVNPLEYGLEIEEFLK